MRAITALFLISVCFLEVDSISIRRGPELRDPTTPDSWQEPPLRLLLQSNSTRDASSKALPKNIASQSKKIDSVEPATSKNPPAHDMATLVDTFEDRYWLNRTTDVNTCGHNIQWASKAKVLKRFSKPVPSRECRSSCRRTLGCNAWFWCGESQDGQCYDWQSRSTVKSKGCLLLRADPRPQPLPKLQDVTDELQFFSYHTGHIKNEMFLRPPDVAIATVITTCKPRENVRSEEHCRYSNWLNQLSISNKQDHARLRGYEFIVEAVSDKRTGFEVMKEIMDSMADVTSIAWILWMDIRSIIYKHEMAFPFISKYERKGHSVAMYGRADKLANGDVFGFEPGVMLLQNTQSARFWLDRVYKLGNDDAAMAKALGEFKQEHGTPYLTAMAALLKAENQKVVAFDLSVCFSCYWKGVELEAPTGFAAFFGGVKSCNIFSLAKDEPEDKEPFNKELVSMVKLARCKHARVLDLSKSRALAEGLDESAPRINMQAFVILPGAFNIKASAADCRKQCQRTHGCNAWMFCWRSGGCDDGHAYRPDWYPYRACELFSMPHNLPLDLQGKGPLFSSASHGFLPKTYFGSKEYPAHALEHLKTPRNRSDEQPNLVIATAIPADACAFPVADYINKLGVSNKHDWAHRHSFELHISAEMIDPNVTAGNWNKLTMIRKVMDATPPEVAEWILWMDSDTVIFNTSLLPRFDAYEGKNFVVWGQEEKLKEGDLEQGLNTGVMMFRNNEWSRAYLADVGQYAYMPPTELKEKMLPILKKEIFPLVSGFYDTPFFVWLLKTKQENFEKAFFEDQISFNRHWLSFEYKTEDVPTLVLHYAGCTICNPPQNKLTDAVTSACASEFFKAHAYSRCKLGTDLLGLPACGYEDAPEVKDLKIRLGQ